MTLFENDFKMPLEIPEKNKCVFAILNNKEKSVVVGQIIKKKFHAGNQDFCYSIDLDDWGSKIFLWCYIELGSRLYNQEKEI